MDKQYQILRPPLHTNFELPSREELLSLKTGDLVKLIFKVSDTESPERMWVVLSDCSDEYEWIGTLDNDSIEPQLSTVIKYGDLVKFHPLDIISIY